MYTIRRIKKKTIKLLMQNISLLFTNENYVGKFSSIIFNKNNDKVKKKLKNYIGNSIDISNVSNNHQN